MIEDVVNLVRDLVVTPQTIDTVDEAMRLFYVDTEGELGTMPAGVDIAGVSTDPTAVQIGSGYGIGGPLELRHVVVVTLAIAGLDGAMHDEIRDPIAAALIARALHANWYNTPVGGNIEIERVQLSVSWAPLLEQPVASWASLVFTIDTAWTPPAPA